MRPLGKLESVQMRRSGCPGWGRGGYRFWTSQRHSAAEPEPERKTMSTAATRCSATPSRRTGTTTRCSAPTSGKLPFEGSCGELPAELACLKTPEPSFQRSRNPEVAPALRGGGCGPPLFPSRVPGVAFWPGPGGSDVSDET